MLSVCAELRSQTATAPSTSLTPGPKPADVSAEWKNLVGIYGKRKETSVTVLERDGQLFVRAPVLNANDDAEILVQKYVNSELFFSNKAGNLIRLIAQANSGGPSAWLLLSSGAAPSPNTDPRSRKSYTFDGSFYFPRADAGADPSHFYRVTPTKPVAELRAAALVAQPPDEPGPFRKPDLVELTTLDPAFHLDIRYAQSNNFLSTPVYTEARAFMQRPAAEALLRALSKLKPLGYGLLIHDAYRPWYVTKIFWDATPPEDHNFVADPQKGSKHNRGCAVDITLYDLATGQPVEMPGLYDEMSPRSFPDFPGGTSLQRWHRDLLRRAIESEGFTVDANEWWHFDYQDWKHYPILNLPFENLSAVSPG